MKGCKWIKCQKLRYWKDVGVIQKNLPRFLKNVGDFFNFVGDFLRNVGDFRLLLRGIPSPVGW